MNSEEIFTIINQISLDKGIDKDVLFEALSSAMASATRKAYRLKATDEIEVNIDDVSKTISIKIDGEEIPAAELGRIAAQTARQVIIQKIKEAEKDVVYNEFASSVGSIVSGSIFKVDRKHIVVDVGRTEGILPRREQTYKEILRQGDKIKALLLEVERTPKGPVLLLSRCRPEFVVKLFEMEAPELKDGIIEIKKIVREPGEHTKLAVWSNNEKVDPKGACIGMRGSRIKSVVTELQGERIDVVRWSDDPIEFIKEALQPAKVEKINIIDKQKKKAEVLVASNQLSLAIGKHGQNVRIASLLTGWDLDIRTEEGSKMTSDLANKTIEDALLSLEGMNEDVINNLREEGLLELNKLAMSGKEDIIIVEGVDEALAKEIIKTARKLLESKGQDE